MSDIFISYARSTATQAQAIAEALRALGYRVWRDDELPAHRVYSEVIEERLKAAKAVVVVWSAEAVKSQWVQSEADRARTDHKLVQLSLDGAALPMPFDRIQCANLLGWTGDTNAHDWRKVISSVAELMGEGPPGAPATAADAAALPLPSKPSIAVMPFANLSNDPEQEYFADGMMEEIVGALSRFRSIFVIASGSTLSFKGKTVAPQEVARQLGVRYLLEGSVRRAGDRVRIAVRLIDATDGAQIWADRFEDTLDDVFALQDRVALSVAAVIEPAVRGAELQQAAKRPTDNRSSYDLYLRATALRSTWKEDDLLAALDLANRAVELDPDYALALAVAANCHAILAIYYGAGDVAGHLAQSAELAGRALRAAGDDADVLSTVALTTSNQRQQLAGAMALSDRALALNPGSSWAWYVGGVLRAINGEIEISTQNLETSVRLDPLSPVRYGHLGWLGVNLFAQGRFGEAVPLLRQSLDLMPAFGISRAVLVSCLGHLGQADAAREVVSQASAGWAGAVALERMFREPEHLALFLEGIDLAEGKAADAGG